jgi:hypothetical protein
LSFRHGCMCVVLAVTGTCVMVPDFDVEQPGFEDDDVLFVPEQFSGSVEKGSRGEFVQRLRQMLAYNPSRGSGAAAAPFSSPSGHACNAYVLAMSPSCPSFFPAEHPTPPPPTTKPEGGDRGGAGAAGSRSRDSSSSPSWMAHALEQPSAGQQRDLARRLVADFYERTSPQFARDPDGYLRDHRDLMGCHSSPLVRSVCGLCVCCSFVGLCRVSLVCSCVLRSFPS